MLVLFLIDKRLKMVYTISCNKNLQITENGENPKVWKQLLLSILATIPYLTQGIETKALPTSTHGGHFTTTPDSVPWGTTAMVVTGAVTAPMFAYIGDRWGRKSGVYIINLVQAASCIPLFLSPTEARSIVLHVLAGISSAGLFTVVPTYIRELNTSLRALSLSLIMLMTTTGSMVQLFMELEAMMYLMVALIAIQFLSLLVLLESPCYLVKVGKMEAAKKNLSKLLCLPEDSPNVTKELEVLKDENDRVAVKSNLIEISKNVIYRDATKIGIVLYTTILLGGSIAFLDEEKALAQLRLTINTERTLVLYCTFAGSLFCFCFVEFFERKYLLTSGFVTIVLSTGLLAVYTQADLTVATLRWVPVAALGLLVFAFGVIWGLPLVVMCEIYNFRIRATMLGALYTYAQIIKLIHIHTFPHIEDYMGLYTIFYIFAGVNIFAGIYSLFAIPFLKGKTVKQVERQLKRVPLLKFNTVNIKV